MRSLEPGYYDKDTLLLHSCFDLLVDYVEVECAYLNLYFNDDLDKKFSWTERVLFKLFGYLSKSNRVYYGIKTLERYDEMLKDPQVFSCPEEVEQLKQQKETDLNVLKLYIWWTQVRPERPEPGEASGWDKWCDEHTMRETYRFVDADVPGCKRMECLLSEEEQNKQSKILDDLHQMEHNQYEQDTEMLCQLMKIRGSLWT